MRTKRLQTLRRWAIGSGLLIGSTALAHAGGTGSATLTPSVAREGGLLTATMTFTVPATGMSAGAQVQVVLPPNWGPTLQTTNSQGIGFVSVSPNTQLGLTVSATAPMATVTAASGTLAASTQVRFTFSQISVACPAPGQVAAPWTIATSSSAADTLAPLSNLPTVNYSVGRAQQLVYSPWNPLVLAAGQPSQALVLQVTDACGHSTVLSSTVSVSLAGQVQDSASNTYSTDTTALFSATPGFTTTAHGLGLSLLPGTSSATYYYENSTTGKNFWIVGNYLSPLDASPQAIWRQVSVLSAAPTFGTPSVDNGTLVTGQTTFTLTPDGDGHDDQAFIRFAPSDNALGWHVMISSTNFVTNVFERWGSGDPKSTLAWDGHNQFQNGAPIVPNGNYLVKIEFAGLAADTSLAISVQTSQISGNVSSGGTPVTGAQVNAQNTSGPGYSSTLTDSAGNYTLAGLKSGNVYNLYASFTSATSQIPITGQLKNVPAPGTGADFALALPGVIRVAATTVAPAAATVFGNLNAHTADYTQNFYGNLRLSSGTTRSDNGDFFTPSTWTFLYVTPGSYILHLTIPGFGVPDQTVTTTAGAVTDALLPLTPQASIFGLIQLPSSVLQPTWVSVQGQLQGSHIASVFGGASFAVGQSSAIYAIYAVPAGNYSFVASPSGVIPQTISNITVGTADIGNATTGSGGQVDFSNFSTGNIISGQITINGDTSKQPSLPLWINVYSPTLGLNAFAQVQASTSATSTSVSYQISGLAPGVYQVNPPYLQGFSLTPPGQLSVNVTSTINVLDMVLAQDTGKISGTITLPAGATDYDQVHLSLQGPAGKEVDLSSGPGFTLSHLGGGYYNLTATYKTSGAQIQSYTVVTNGKTQAVNFDLSALTYSVAGTVSVQSGFSIMGSSGSPVTINTLSDLRTNATSQTLVIGGRETNGPNGPACQGGTAALVSAARVEAFPKNFNSYNDANRNGFGNCFGVGAYKYGTIQADGSYVIPQLAPGVWEIDVYPYFDGGQSPNVATVQKIVTVSNGGLTGINFGLSNGNAVSGTLNLPPGLTDTRTFEAQMLDDQGNLIQQSPLQIVSGSSTTFQFSNLPAGAYSLQIQDQGSYDPNTGQNATKYVAKPVQITIQGVDLTGVTVTMVGASRIVGQLAIQQTNPQDGSTTLTLITSANRNLLPSDFSAIAQADPWIEGGYRSANFSTSGNGIGIDSNNQFTIDGLVAGTYDVNFQQNSFGAASQGAGSLNIASYSQGPINVPPGQTLNLGTITLLPGLSVSGQVTDTAGNPLGNIRVTARPSNSQNGNDSTEAFTDALGQFNLAGLSPTIKIYDFTAARRPHSGDTVQAVPYGQVILKAVDVTQVPTTGLRFALPSATASLTGKVVTADGGSLSYPQGKQAGYPEAAIFLRAQGTVSEDNPLGDDSTSNLDGTFTIPYLAAGVYDITLESLGYKPLKLVGVTLGSDVNDLGTLTLQKGPSLSVTLAKPDGTRVNTKDVQFAVAVTPDLGTILFGKVNSDANTSNINTIDFSGFELSPTAYSVLLFDANSNISAPSEGRNLVFNSNADALVKALTYAPSVPGALTHVLKVGSAVSVTYYFTRPLRNRLDDQDPTQWVTITSGGGTLSGHLLSGDRRQFTVLYNPAPGEQNATLRLAAHTIDLDPATGTEFPLVKSVTLLLGQKATTEGNVTSALGGSLSLSDSNDPSSVKVPANTLLTSTGSAVDPTVNYALTFTATDSPAGVPAGAGAHSPALQGLMARGPGAYVSEAYQAMGVAKAQTINPLSSFYSVLLPAGLSHSLNQTAFLTLSYNTSADPSQINVYYFDGTKYLIQPLLRTVDPVNHTITVGVTHFSTFVVLQNNAPVVLVTGSASAASSDIEVFNFPNPFDLQAKTKTLAHGGTSGSLTTQGTIIRYAIPAANGGPAKIVIYDQIGQKVRTIDLGTPTTGVENYVAWDGKNDSGNKVASGVYIGELKVGGQMRFWKMAVIK